MATNQRKADIESNVGREDRDRERDTNPDANRDPITGAPGSHPAGTAAGAAAGGVRPSGVDQAGDAYGLEQFVGGKKVGDFEGGGVGGVGAVGAVAADAGAEVVADGAGGGFLGVGGAHGIAPLGDGVFRFEHHHEHLARAHEFHQLAEEAFSLVDRIKPFGFRSRQPQ